MRVLVTAPTAFEIDPFRKKFPQAECLIAGVGAAFTIYHLTKTIQLTPFDMVIQAGVAGSFTTDFPLSEVVNVKTDCFADLGAFEKNNFSSVYDLSLADMNHFPFMSGQLINMNAEIFVSKLKPVNAITVNTLSDDDLRIRIFQKKYHASIETMEGAALHYVCLQEKIPFIQLRAISNYVGERNKSKWKLPEAVDRLNAELADVYSSFVN
ncbi:MAG: futalosine hydrolase [Ferruginibacter sp.]|nr:futalosine hydrolase [Ferruginibacter sp.]